MPIDYKKYPKNWANIRAVVMARAGEQRAADGTILKEACCEECGLMNHTRYHRMPNDEVHRCCDWPGETSLCAYCGDLNHKPVGIVLTVAHLDHDPENDDVCVTRLRALCQKCHLAYDGPVRFMHRDRKRGQDYLFPMEI